MSESLYSPPPDDLEALHAQLYAGAIVRFSDLDAMRELVAHARGFVEARLAPHDPVRIHEALDREALALALADVQRAFSRDSEAKRLWRALFEAVGFDPDDTARDRLLIRFQPPVPAEGGPHRARSTGTVGFHRDSWGTNLYAQVNWWSPVYPITHERSFAFLPDLFDQPIPNDSDSFDLAEVIERGRLAGPAADRGRMAPAPLPGTDFAAGQAVVIDPGEVIAFSAQHAHVGVQNHSSFTRISLESRTLRLSDFKAGRGARNVDGKAKWMAHGMFRRLSDGALMTDVMQLAPLAPFCHGLD